MRNLKQYPVTADEVITTLQGMHLQELDTVGDTRALILAGILRLLVREPVAMKHLLEDYIDG